MFFEYPWGFPIIRPPPPYFFIFLFLFFFHWQYGRNISLGTHKKIVNLKSVPYIVSNFNIVALNKIRTQYMGHAAVPGTLESSFPALLRLLRALDHLHAPQVEEVVGVRVEL